MARTAIRPSPLILDFPERADTASHNGKRILQCSLTTTNPRTERNGLHLDPVVTSEQQISLVISSRASKASTLSDSHEVADRDERVRPEPGCSLRTSRHR